ncbi:CPCC family cysteine-rich protein [Marinobacter alkaliphilus]|uniref:CPCC family cysteine-rich protein n=1 Tax=Marinobacter alkaliphilus TaxID=254719 RepID=UPI003D767441
MKLNQCPCCDYFTLPDGQDYEICPVCFWEDDSFGIEELDAESGANKGLTIRQARANFAKYGACDPDMVRNVLPTEKRSLYGRELRSIRL